MRLIDADALLERIKKDPLFPLVEEYGISGVIKAEPTAEAIPIEFIKNLHKEAIEYRDHLDSFWQAPAWNRADNQAIGINSVLQVWEDRHG